MKNIWNSLLLISLIACSQGSNNEDVAVVEAVDDRSSFPGKYSIAGDQDYIDEIKQLCISTGEIPEEQELEQALGCLYSGELKKSYFLYKLQLPNLDKKPLKKALVLNNMGVIQMNWGHKDLAESLFSESIEVSRNIMNVFNFLKIQVEDGAFTNQSLIPFIENADLQGNDLDLLKAKISVVQRKNETAIQNYDSMVSKESEVINYLYFLYNIKSDIKFKEVAQRFESEVGDNVSFLIMNEKIGP